MANKTLLQSNYRMIHKNYQKFKNDNLSTDDMLKAYRQATQSIPDVYTKTGKENEVKPIGLTVANRNLSYAIRHYDYRVNKMDLNACKKVIKQNNGKNHWILYNSKSHNFINPTREKVSSLVQNYQHGLHHSLSHAIQQQRQRENDELTL